MEWAVVTDTFGTEIGVVGQPGNLIAFPANAVAKRSESKEIGFFKPLFGMFAEHRKGHRTSSLS